MATAESLTDVAPLSLRLPTRPAATAAARHALERLCELLPAEVLSNARLLTSELVANAVRHSGQGEDGWVEVEARVQPQIQTLSLAVRDGGGGFVPRIEPSLERGGGFGLYMVDELSSGWGVRRSERGTEVWLTLGWDSARAA